MSSYRKQILFLFKGLIEFMLYTWEIFKYEKISYNSSEWKKHLHIGNWSPQIN